MNAGPYGRPGPTRDPGSRPGLLRSLGGVAGLGVGGFLILFGGIWLLVVLVIGGAWGGFRAYLDDDYVKVEGAVVDLVRSQDSDGGTSCRPVVAYLHPVTSEPATVTSVVSESPCRVLGEVTAVYVDQTQSGVAVVDPLSGTAGVVLPIFAVLGGGFLAVGCVALVGGVVALRRGRREARAAAGGTPGSMPVGAYPPPSPGTVPPPPPVGGAAGYPGRPGVPQRPASGRPADPYGPPSGTWGDRDDDGRSGGGAQVAPPLF